MTDLDYGVLAYGTPNWRAARVATSADYVAFEASISAGLQRMGPQNHRGFLVANSPGNPLANFNELGSGVWTNPRAISMSLQEGKLFTPAGSMQSHICESSDACTVPVSVLASLRNTGSGVPLLLCPSS